MDNIIYIHKIKKNNVVITDELLDHIAENYQIREEDKKEMTFEEYLEYELWKLSK